jgi:hypothetical protein
LPKSNYLEKLFTQKKSAPQNDMYP